MLVVVNVYQGNEGVSYGIDASSFSNVDKTQHATRFGNNEKLMKLDENDSEFTRREYTSRMWRRGKTSHVLNLCCLLLLEARSHHPCEEDTKSNDGMKLKMNKKSIADS